MTDTPVPRAVDRRFRTLGFSERDALVVRSMVRLLAGRTRDRWHAVDLDPVHLVVVPVGFAGDLPAGTAAMNVALPLRADDLWSQLDRVSAQLALDEGMLRPSRGGGAGGGPGGGGGGGGAGAGGRGPGPSLAAAALASRRAARVRPALPPAGHDARRAAVRHRRTGGQVEHPARHVPCVRRGAACERRGAVADRPQRPPP